MQCRNNKIKELLPAYVGEGLTGNDRVRVEEHLHSCEDCGREARLLRMMAAESVPDPGEAFWAEMPGRVYQDVQRLHPVRGRKVKENRFDIFGLVRSLVLPRWAWAVAGAGAILLFSWLLMNPVRQDTGEPSSSGTGYSSEYDDVLIQDPLLAYASGNVAELTQTDLDTVAAWAGKQLSAIAVEAEAVMPPASDADLYEELAELNTHQIERLSVMLKERNREG